MDGAVAKRLGERLVHEAVLVEQRESLEPRARDDDLIVVAATGPVLDQNLAGVGKCLAQKRLEPLDRHLRHRSPAAYASGVPELGLFPLGVVLLPTERVPLHVFEPRYKELIGECLDSDGEFGLVLADDDGLRAVGTRAAVTDVLHRFPDGRMNVVVEGGERFRLVRLTSGRSFQTAEVEPLEDEDPDAGADVRALAVERYGLLADAAGSEAEELDAEAPALSFEIAARIDFGAEVKQQLLETRSEPERLETLVGLLDEAAQAVSADRERAEQASTNGKVTPLY